MTQPNSKYLDYITFDNLSYLTDTFASTITSDNFNMTTGKPLTNMAANSTVDNFFINTVSQSLQERFNVNNDFIYQYPQVLELESMRDLEITNETTIDVVFVHEGASMKNMVGYYFYEIDGNGDKRLLDNNGVVVDYYYKPTVIFPNVTSENGDSNTLQRGNTRRLKGNLPNGNFANIHIGFFLICFGWYAFENGSEINPDKILHSTLEFNVQYRNTEFQMVNDKIYSVYVKSKAENGDELLLLAFEDLFAKGPDDLDYNDCVMGFVISDVNNVVDYDKFAELVLEEEPTYNNIIFLDDEGEYLELPDNIYNIDNNQAHIFERHLIFDNQPDRDAYILVMFQLLTNYYYQITSENTETEYKIIVKYLFRPNDLLFNSSNGKKKLYLLKAKFNKHIGPIVDQYRLLMQKNLQDPNYIEDYKLYQRDNQAEVVINLADNIDHPRKESADPFRIIGNGVMDCRNGKAHLPFKDPYIYQVYKNTTFDGDGLVINVKMDDHPDGYQLGSKYFVRWIGFVVDGTENVVIDLGNLNVYQESGGSLTLISDVATLNSSLTGINIGDVTAGSDTIKGLVSVFRNNSGATFRIITIKDSMKFYCIRFPNIKNNPTMVFLDADVMINWSEAVNIISGTYYKKQRTFLVSNLTTV